MIHSHNKDKTYKKKQTVLLHYFLYLYMEANFQESIYTVIVTLYSEILLSNIQYDLLFSFYIHLLMHMFYIPGVGLCPSGILLIPHVISFHPEPFKCFLCRLHMVVDGPSHTWAHNAPLPAAAGTSILFS